MKDFTIMTDSSANLTPDLAREADIEVIPLHCMTQDGGVIPCYDETPLSTATRFMIPCVRPALSRPPWSISLNSPRPLSP